MNAGVRAYRVVPSILVMESRMGTTSSLEMSLTSGKLLLFPRIGIKI